MNYVYPCKPNWLSPNSDFFNRLDNDPAWIAEVKKNGWRCLAARDENLPLWTRHHTTINDTLPEIRATLQGLPSGTVLDGELLQNRTKQIKGVYYVFDILQYEGESTMVLPLYARRPILEACLSNLLRQDGLILAAQTRIGKKKLFYDSIEGEANEGIVIKKLNSVYMASEKRCLQHPQWLKVKRIESHIKTN
jgi:bifunctional non-homologous end joining protein LigD